jgi:ABC-2 type transport system ATP-binding protein
VREAALFGRAIHVTVADGRTALPALRDALAAKGVQVERIAPVAPSLEDAFVSLVDRSGDSPATGAGPEGTQRG